MFVFPEALSRILQEGVSRASKTIGRYDRCDRPTGTGQPHQIKFCYIICTDRTSNRQYRANSDMKNRPLESDLPWFDDLGCTRKVFARSRFLAGLTGRSRAELAGLISDEVLGLISAAVPNVSLCLRMGSLLPCSELSVDDSILVPEFE